MASYPRNDSEFSDWLNTFISVANGNVPASGLTAADITALQAAKTNLDARLAAEDLARQASIGATAAKNQARRDANVLVSSRATMVLANTNVTTQTKEAMGLNVRSKPTATAPAIPQTVTVEPFANGVHRLAWSGNGNTNRTVYIVEQKVSQNGAWRIVGAVTATKFDHANQTPGRMAIYRVKAKRGNVETAASPETVAYADAAFPLEDTGIA